MAVVRIPLVIASFAGRIIIVCMGVEIMQGDIFETDAAAIVNAVNCVGIMGKGLALVFKKRYPDNFAAYATACRTGACRIGRVFAFRSAADSRLIINFPSKRHWRNPSQLGYIRVGLRSLRQTLKQQGINSVALPALGCGEGCLPWEAVRDLTIAYFSQFPELRVVLYAPRGH